MEDPEFLGFGAFETTAFLTAVLVASYSLISNPTGRQSSSESAEYQVYAGWRFALIVLFLQLSLMLFVIVQQSFKPEVPANAKAWLIALMVAPWAPVAGKVRDTVTSFYRVRRLMKSRLTRNELAAIIRDRFKFGQRGIALPSIIFHATGGDTPAHPIAALRANSYFAVHEDALREQAEATAQTDEPCSLDLGALWAMNQSRQPTSISRTRLFLWRGVSACDLLARAWTEPRFCLDADPMPGIKSDMERALYLDVADLLQQGNTVSDELMERGLRRFCERCRLSVRGAVEAFLESSERGHTDLRAGKWLKNIGMNWRGQFERVIDVMWEAAFMDAKGFKLEISQKDDVQDESPDYDDRAKVTTTKTFALLFLIIRSLLKANGEHGAYETVAAIVRDGPFTRVWWERYWARLEEIVRAKRVKGGPADLEKPVVCVQMRADFKAALRDLVDDDVKGIVEEFLQHADDSLCGDTECYLNPAKILVQEYRNGKVVPRARTVDPKAEARCVS
ncbi:unnamed protein product [Chondrus crispus]|uniref:Uncharacterized protein n=1 Tax=Chondrus crispus TaxID=2769 RepID=R7QQR0_CHOCR|nr:unnamed protein product [Chondrus crispus]CDF40073.1 unnamed protein product [Chondrus crispus]|eukprot:XP_005710367.1 unnamed protein product [Chondrus crispus]